MVIVDYILVFRPVKNSIDNVKNAGHESNDHPGQPLRTWTEVKSWAVHVRGKTRSSTQKQQSAQHQPCKLKELESFGWWSEKYLSLIGGWTQRVSNHRQVPWKVFRLRVICFGRKLYFWNGLATSSANLQRKVFRKFRTKLCENARNFFQTWVS